MNFIVRNESFQCRNCRAAVSPLTGSCRNHCPKCLYSLHVDQKFPGDRASECRNLMKPLAIKHSGKKGWMIQHECLKCSHQIPNKAAPDDNMELLIELSKKPWIYT